jgi:hypothetical protein
MARWVKALLTEIRRSNMSKILKGLNEVNPNNYDSDWDYQDAVAKSGKSRSNYRSQEDDTSDADIAYSKKMYQLGQQQKAAKEKAQRDSDHDRLATGTNEGMMPIGGNSTATDRRKVMDLLQVYYKSMGGDFWEWFNQPGNKEFFANRAGVSSDSAYEVVDSIDWGQHPQEEWPEDEEDMREGLDNPWGDQGNFVGDKPVSLGDVSIKNIQTGDTVKYLGQSSKVVAMSKDRKYSRITISKGMGTITQDVLTSDLQQLGQGVREEQLDELSNEKLGQYKTAAALDAGKADKQGDYKRADKRFSGIVKATKKQFANDTKKSSIGQGMAEADEKPAEPFKTGYPRVNNPKILGTQNRAKSIYHPPSKPNVKKLDKPLPENLGNELKSKSLEALQQVKQQLEQQRMAELEQWEKDFKQNTVSKFTAREPNLRQRATSTSMVAMPGEKHSELKTRLGQLNKAIEKQGILDKLVEKLDKKGLLTPNIEAGVDTSMLARDGARDNYVELNKKLDKALEYVKNRLLTNKAAYAKPKSIDEDELDENCWKGYHKEGNKELFGKTVPNCVKNKKKKVAEGYQLDEGAIETITALVKKIPGIGKYYQMAQQYKPQLIDILKTSKSGKEVKQKMEQLAAGQSATVTESGMMKQLGGLAVGGGSILSTMWMNAMGMIDGVLANAAAGEVGGAVASGSILGLIPVTLMLFAAMLLFKGSKQSSDEKAQAFQAQRGRQGVTEEQHSCPHCGGEMVNEELMNEKKDACYYKVKSRYKVWPSAYASGALVKCRKSGADSWGNGGKKNESSILEGIERADESLHDWFNKEKWVRMDTKGNIKGPCAREPGEGKPKCLPQSKAHSLGKKGRASAAQRKRREDPNPERSGKAINVDTKKNKG